MELCAIKGLFWLTVCTLLSVKAQTTNKNCPAVNPDIRCVRFDPKCQSDRDCSNGKICCGVPCGTNCVDNTYQNPFVCPPFTPVPIDECARRGTLNECDGDDSRCPRNQKCCPEACGGTRCKGPTTPFVCPAFTPVPIDECARRGTLNECDGDDSKCPRNQKCCPEACGGSRCKGPTTNTPLARPGVCPTPPPIDLDFCARAFVLSDCRVDSDCRNLNQKCCPGVCGALQCTDALTGNRPGCPPYNPLLRCIIYNQQCNSDNDCDNGRLCCYQPACGTSCVGGAPCPTPICKALTPGACSRRVFRTINGVRCEVCPEEVPCTGQCAVGKPLPNIFCGRGPNRQDCPPGFYCNIDPTDKFAVCCRRNKPGRCPKTDPNLVCTLQVRPGDCTDDKSCPRNKKCCRVGCNRVCVGPEPECGPVCAIFCPFGNVLDDEGCPTCRCKTGCKNEAQPVAGVTCGSGGTRCPGAYTCVTPPSGGGGVCCPLDNAVCEKGQPLPNVNCGGIGFPICKQGYYCNNGRCCQIPCKYGEPHPTLTCGMVAGSNQCPAGYSCLAHPADAYFACCPDEPKACLTCCGDPPCCNRCDKPGTCPAPGQAGTCVNECNLDIDCPGDEKCCSNGCGRVCRDPAGSNPVKDGQCPTLPPGTVGTCVELCSGDSSCPGDQKCCSNGCGHVCKDPVNPDNPKCRYGVPLPNINCGRGLNRQDCPSGYSCNVHPTDRYAVCCANSPCKPPTCPRPPPDVCTKPRYVTVQGVKCPACYDIVPCPPKPKKRCPADPKPTPYCYKVNYWCKNDRSCKKGEKCCRQGCCYKCVKAV